MNGLKSSGQIYDEWSFDTATWRNLSKLLGEIEPVTFTVTNVKPRGVYENLIPVRITYSPPATICYFPDGDKIVVKCASDEKYIKEVGVQACIMKKLFGSRHHFLKLVHAGYDQPTKKDKEEITKEHIQKIIDRINQIPDEE